VILIDQPADDPTSADICDPRDVGNGADRILTLKADPSMWPVRVVVLGET
jgi:hypothetical protein